jgi:hypothetical protein
MLAPNPPSLLAPQDLRRSATPDEVEDRQHDKNDHDDANDSNASDSP